jgi:hypothetical protein
MASEPIDRRQFPRDEEVYIVHTNLAKVRVIRSLLSDITPNQLGSPEYGIEDEEFIAAKRLVYNWTLRLEARTNAISEELHDALSPEDSRRE